MFNIVGRIISTALGLVLVCLGVVWILQAYNVAFNTPRVPGGPVSFMVNDHQWAAYARSPRSWASTRSSGPMRGAAD